MASSFTQLPDELILLILSHCDIPDLLALSRTTHQLRSLSCDHILHAQRLLLAALHLAHVLPNRPSYSSVSPPSATILLTPTHVLARTLSRQLVSIKLNRNLSRRPSATELVNHNILPQECCKRLAGSREIVVGAGVAPSILMVKRRIEREKLKDGLRAWLERKAETVNQQARREESKPQNVTGLVRIFTDSKKSRCGCEENVREYTHAKWGRRGWEMQKETTRREPTRARVWALRRFWESGNVRGVGVSIMV